LKLPNKPRLWPIKDYRRSQRAKILAVHEDKVENWGKPKSRQVEEEKNETTREKDVLQTSVRNCIFLQIGMPTRQSFAM